VAAVAYPNHSWGDTHITGTATYWYKVKSAKGSLESDFSNADSGRLKPTIVPPVASLTANPTTGQQPLTVNFDASGSSDDGTIVSYNFDFGDGDTETTASPTTAHTYTPGGIYQARVTVTDDDGATDTSDTVTITVSEVLPPVADITVDDSGPVVGETVTFDASGSYDPDGGSITKYEWDFDGDGTWDEDTGCTSTASHVYGDSGNYDATVRVTDDEGVPATDAVAVAVTHLSPVANLSASPTSGQAPLTVSFDASGSYDRDEDGSSIVKYEFDFDDGGGWEDYGTSASASHTYNSAARTYYPAVRVTDDEGGTDTDSVTVVVEEPNLPPVAIFTRSPASGVEPLNVSFDGSGSYDQDEGGDSIVNYEWDWDGNGTWDYDSGNDATVNHTYSAGTYHPKLRVTDDEGDTDVSDPQTVTVGEPEELDYIEPDPSLNLPGSGTPDDPYILDGVLEVQMYAYSTLGNDMTDDVTWDENSNVPGTGFSGTTRGKLIVSPFDSDFRVWATFEGVTKYAYFHVQAPS